MKIIKDTFLTLFFLIVLPTLIFGQEKKVISGRIIDASTKVPLSNASIYLKDGPVGTISGDNGEFNLSLPEGVLAKSLIIRYVGYVDYLLDIYTIKTPLEVEMIPAISQLDEVVVRPRSPLYYIKLAMLKVQENYPNAPYVTEAFYREKIVENNNFIKFNECIFKTYHSSLNDTLKNQNQLLLYRQPERIQELKFMAKERKAEELRGKNKSEGKPRIETGGPGTVQYLLQINKKSDDFLDSTKFKNFIYSFSNVTEYNGKDVIVILFKSKGKVDHLKKEGKIFIDPFSNAIFRIEGSGNFIIPLLYRPILFIYGVSTDELSFKAEKEYQKINGRWYPKNILINLKVDVTKRHWFRENEHSNFGVELIFNVFKFQNLYIRPIDREKLFDPKREMASQVHNDSGISWEVLKNNHK